MLVLTRRTNQKIYLKTSDGLITVVVLESTDGKMRIGIDAPHTVEIERDDVKHTPGKEVQG